MNKILSARFNFRTIAVFAINSIYLHLYTPQNMLVVFYGYFRNSVIAPEDKTLKCSILLWNSSYILYYILYIVTNLEFDHTQHTGSFSSVMSISACSLDSSPSIV